MTIAQTLKNKSVSVIFYFLSVHMTSKIPQCLPEREILRNLFLVIEIAVHTI